MFDVTDHDTTDYASYVADDADYETVVAALRSIARSHTEYTWTVGNHDIIAVAPVYALSDMLRRDDDRLREFGERFSAEGRGRICRSSGTINGYDVHRYYVGFAAFTGFGI